MAGGFAITTTTTSAKLPANRQGQFQFTVTNTSGRQLTVRGKAVAQTPEQNGWFTIEGPTERLCAANATLNYTVNVAIPATAPATPITFRLDAVGVENPDEYNSQGPAIVLEVPPASVPNKPFPWWIVAVAAAVILVLGGGGALAYKFVSSTNKPVAKASPTPSPDLLAGFEGAWVGSIDPSGAGFKRVVITRQGPKSVSASFDGSCFRFAACVFDATGTYEAGRITFKWTPPQGSGFMANDPVTVYANLEPSGNTMDILVSSVGHGRIGLFALTRPCPPNCLFERPRPTAIAIG
jgi:hypothetical protein